MGISNCGGRIPVLLNWVAEATGLSEPRPLTPIATLHADPPIHSPGPGNSALNKDNSKNGEEDSKGCSFQFC